MSSISAMYQCAAHGRPGFLALRQIEQRHDRALLTAFRILSIMACAFATFSAVKQSSRLMIERVSSSCGSSVDLPEHDIHGAHDCDGIGQHMALAEKVSGRQMKRIPGARMLQR